jgi:1,4-dihydroxy-2-naphthoate octaprenyltransferase
MPENNKNRTKFSIWVQTVRAFSFPASLIPSLLGVMFAILYLPQQSTWWLIPFIMISLVCLHAASNVVSDYDDFNRGVDYKGSLGGSGVLVEGLLTPKQAYRGAMVLYGVAILFGIPIIIEKGFIILAFGLIGMLSGYFYTAKPVGFKYIALGDFIFFFLYGPAITLGTYYALTGSYHFTVFLASIPLGLLVSGILHANNLRDIIHDRKANIKTFATVMGEGFAKGEYIFLITGAYAVIIILVVFGVLSPWSLLVFLSLPPAIKNMSSIKGIKIEDTGKIAMLDVQTAQLTLLFGVLLSISVLLTKLI